LVTALETRILLQPEAVEKAAATQISVRQSEKILILAEIAWITMSHSLARFAAAPKDA
jgi:hypothetical protein